MFQYFLSDALLSFTWQTRNEALGLEEVVVGVDNSMNKMLGPSRFDSGPEEGAPSREIGVAERPRRQNFRH